MQYFKHFINKFCFKVKSSNLFKFFFGCVFLFFFIPNVKASEVLFGPSATFQIGNAIKIDEEHNSIPYTNSFSSNPLNLGAISISISPQSSGAESILGSPTFNYLIIEMCTSGTVRLNVSNSSTINSFLVTGGYNGFDLGTTGTVSSNNYTCYNNLYQIPIGKWVLGEYSEWFEVDSYFNFERVSSSGNFFKITKVFLSDEDLLAKYQSQAQLVNKLNDVQSAINSQTNTINSNIDSESTAIQNKIEAAKNQAHTDATNIKNSVDSIKNQDHSYNNNPSESLNGRHDLDEYSYESAQLRNALILDSSDLDVSFNTNASNFIWSFVSNIRNTNAKFTIFLTAILSLGIIKLILNR